MVKILISACLAGDRVRYDGRQIPVTDNALRNLKETGQLVNICPEVTGGLEIPRPRAEIVNGNGLDVLNGTAKVIDIQGRDVTLPFIRGAEQSLNLARRFNITIAILKENSPSCGVHHIYDGTFTAKFLPGFGVTTALLGKNGIRVFSENELDRALAILCLF